MQQKVKDFFSLVVDSFEYQIQEPIYEFGSFLPEGQKELANLRSFFPDKKYIGCDMREGDGVDKVLNLHNIDLENESAGTVICLETLEHVEYPQKALKEIYRILKPGGIAVISSAMNFRIHAYPSDYWRFTPFGFKSLLQYFENQFVGFHGDKYNPSIVVGIGFKKCKPDIQDFYNKYCIWNGVLG